MAADLSTITSLFELATRMLRSLCKETRSPIVDPADDRPKRAFCKMFELVHLGPNETGQFAAWTDGRLQLEQKIEGDAGFETVHRGRAGDPGHGSGWRSNSTDPAARE
jgi:hypothetical protein